MKLLTQSRERMASDLPSDWYSAENRHLYDLEFFNRIRSEADENITQFGDDK